LNIGSLQEFKTHIDEALARRLLTLEESGSFGIVRERSGTFGNVRDRSGSFGKV